MTQPIDRYAMMKLEGDMPDPAVLVNEIKLSELNDKERQILWRCRHIHYGTVTVFIEAGSLTRIEEKKSYKLIEFE